MTPVVYCDAQFSDTQITVTHTQFTVIPSYL
uniref:Uncharacterized protein n=1 Tax=Trichinella nativa TaxID=6335 RepID=A0A0V1JJX2_9BILA